MRRQRVRRKLLFFSFLLFPITLNYFSPYLMTQGAAAGILTASLLVWTAVFLTSLFTGRAFCGWGCPFHGLQHRTTPWTSASAGRDRLRRFTGNS